MSDNVWEWSNTKIIIKTARWKTQKDLQQVVIGLCGVAPEVPDDNYCRSLLRAKDTLTLRNDSTGFRLAQNDEPFSLPFTLFPKRRQNPRYHTIQCLIVNPPNDHD